ncbi:MAG: transglycosylase SLT domain-containing protein [Myxococcota bacterium]
MCRVLLAVWIAMGASGCSATAQEVRRAPIGASANAAKSHGWKGSAVKRCEAVVPLLEEASHANNIDHALLVGIVKVESTFRPEAVSRVGALGLMQVMPRNGDKLACGDLREPEANIACGVKVLKGFLRYYKDDIVYALSGYNAGFAQPNLARRQARLPKNRSYVEKVLAARASYLRYGCGS